MVDEVRFRNVVTDEEITMYRAKGTVILDSIDWGSPEIKFSSFRVPFQVGSTIKGMTIGERSVMLSGFVRADTSMIDKVGLEWETYFKEQKESIEKTKDVLNRLFSPYQDIEITSCGHSIIGRPEQSLKYSIMEQENNEVQCYFTLSLICNFPMFTKDEQHVELAHIIKMFHFPLIIDATEGTGEGVVFGEIALNQAKLITNGGDAPVGCVIRMIAHGGTVNNPKLINVSRNEYIGFTGVSLSDGDYIEVNTTKGKESVFKYVGGVRQSMIGNLMSGSKFLQINTGGEYYFYDMDGSEQNLQIVIEFSETVFNFKEM